MRAGSSDALFLGQRGRSRLNTRLKKARKTRNRWIDLEGLESRTLLATIPAATATGAPINLSPTNPGYADSPIVAINPYDSQEVVAAWVDDIPALTESFVDGSYSTDGGATWNSLPAGINQVLAPQAQATDPGVAFDSKGNVFVMDSQHAAVTATGNPVPASGALVLSEFSFSGTGASAVLNTDYINQPVYQWVSNTTGDAVLNPVLAVDPGTYPDSSPTSSPPAGIPNDPHANNVYIAWVSNDIAAGEVNYPGLFNPNRIELIVSSDGGQSFSGVTTVNNGGATSVPLPGGLTYVNPDDGNNADLDTSSPQDNAHPQLVINPNDDGQITVGWNNLFTGALQLNTVQAGNSYPATQLLDSIGNIFGPQIPDPRGNWVPSSYNAGPNGVVADPVSIAVGDVNTVGGTENDIVVADAGSGQIGVLLELDDHCGNIPPGAAVYSAGTNPSDVVLADLVPGHTTNTILDALVANDTAAGGVSIVPDGTPPTDGTGVFVGPTSYAAGQGTTRGRRGQLRRHRNPDRRGEQGSNSVSILDPATGAILKTLTTGLDDAHRRGRR